MIIKALVIVLLLMPTTVHAFERYNRVVKYDKYFSKYSKRYFGPGFDWHYFKLTFNTFFCIHRPIFYYIITVR